jgi:N-acetylmuramoyl-L-alanine amidase
MREKVVSTGNLVRGEGTTNGHANAGGADVSVSKTSGGPASIGTAMPNVTAIQTTSHENDAQIVVLLDGPVQYDSARISSPDRIYFDLHNTRLNLSVEQKAVPVEGGLLKWVRAAQNSDDVVRLVLEADGAKDYSAQFLSEPDRLVIDVHGDPAAVSNRKVGPAVPTGISAGTVGQLSLARELGLKISRIVIDAGHGGYDTGTTGPRGLLEKDLCLDVALRLGRLVGENIPGAQVVYTRKDDSFVPLEERTTMANDANADLFISIHANSSESKEIRGVETYYMSLATTREARELAAHENTFGQSSLHDLPGLIRKITSNEKIAESRQLAGNIQNALSLRLQSVSRQEVNRGVKRAPFLVLTGANMPAVLSEISFVSNASDENLLLEGTQRERVADGLYRGIAAYLDSMHAVPSKKQKVVTDNRTSASSGPGF